MEEGWRGRAATGGRLVGLFLGNSHHRAMVQEVNSGWSDYGQPACWKSSIRRHTGSDRDGQGSETKASLVKGLTAGDPHLESL